MRVRVPFIITVFIIGLHFGCKRRITFSYDIPSIESTTKTENVSINYLANHYGKFHSRYIQTEGTYYLGLEHFAIVADGMMFSNNRFAFWLSIKNGLIPKDDWQLISKGSGQRVVIKGEIDTSMHGHMGQYSATIKNVYFFKTK